MNEDPTKEMPGARPFEERVLNELAAIRSEVADVRADVAEIRADVAEIRADVAEIRARQTAMAKNIAVLDERLTSLEEKVDARLNETRPIWEAIQLAIDRLDEKFDNVIRDLYEVRTDIGLHDKRLRDIERRLNT